MLNKLSNIKALVFDCDGVMTKGEVLFYADGDAPRVFNIKDGFAVQHAVKQGYIVAIISGGNHIGITKRFEALGVKDIFLAQSHKADAYLKLKSKYGLNDEEVLYMGDDMPDIPLLSLVGLPTCPADAASDILEHAAFISSFKGGEGCVREVIEMVMKAQNKWFTDELHHF